jgi:hypothetical protein
VEEDRKAAARRDKTEEEEEAAADTADVAASAGEDTAGAADTTETMSESEREKWEKELVEGVYRVVDEKAVFVPVETGIADEAKIEVSGDLDEGDRIVNGPFRVLRELKEGTRIKKIEDDDR